MSQKVLTSTITEIKDIKGKNFNMTHFDIKHIHTYTHTYIHMRRTLNKNYS